MYLANSVNEFKIKVSPFLIEIRKDTEKSEKILIRISDLYSKILFGLNNNGLFIFNNNNWYPVKTSSNLKKSNSLNLLISHISRIVKFKSREFDFIKVLLYDLFNNKNISWLPESNVKEYELSDNKLYSIDGNYQYEYLIPEDILKNRSKFMLVQQGLPIDYKKNKKDFEEFLEKFENMNV